MIPITYNFVALEAAALAQQAKGFLMRIKPARTGKAPDWDNRGAEMVSEDVPSPYTDIQAWQDRYVLCELAFRKEDGDTLVMNDAVVAISRKRNIVSTQLVGMNGTVKEYISDGDYQLNIMVGVQALDNGVIVDKYPAEGIQQLREYFDEQAAIQVQSKFLELFDIDKIVVTEFAVVQATESNYQPISITAVSDTDYNVYSTEY
jgi:hypothetical protein